MSLKTINEIREALLTEQPYWGCLLSTITVKSDPKLPFLAGIGVHKKLKNLQMYLGAGFWGLEEKTQIAVILHELHHVVFCHVNSDLASRGVNLQLLNMAGDIAINQEIPNLPEEGLFPETFGLPKGLSTWQYYDLIKSKVKEVKAGFDDHGGMNGETAKEVAEASKDAIKKTEQFANQRGIGAPASVARELKDYDKRNRRDVAKRILQHACKMSLQAKDLEKTYARQNRRYGPDFPGNRAEERPKILFGIDTSGSITDDQVGMAMEVLFSLNKSIGADIVVALWHTNVYATKTVSKVDEVKSMQFESGGTDIQDFFDLTAKTQPDLAVVLTDGEFSMPAKPPKSKLVWVLNTDNKQWNEPRTVRLV